MLPVPINQRLVTFRTKVDMIRKSTLNIKVVILPIPTSCPFSNASLEKNLASITQYISSHYSYLKKRKDE